MFSYGLILLIIVGSKLELLIFPIGIYILEPIAIGSKIYTVSSNLVSNESIRRCLSNVLIKVFESTITSQVQFA